MAVKEYDPKELTQASAPPSATPDSEPTMAQRIGTMAGNLGKGLGESAVGLMSTGDEFARKHLPAFFTNSNMGFGAPANLEHVKQMATPDNTTQAIGKGLGDAAQFLIPGGAEEAAASMAPKAIRPLAKIAAGALGSGAVNEAQGGSFGTGAALGAGGEAIGSGLKAVAPSLAEGAMKVRGNQRLFGRTVGDAIINDTKGIRPETIAQSAKSKIAELTPELNAEDQASMAAGQRGSLNPARQAVNDIRQGHLANRAVQTAEEIEPISEFLNRDALTGLPLSANQTAPGLRTLKRGLNEDYIGKWSLDQPAAQKSAARTAYGDINRELHRISPGTASLDQRISSLIPVKQQGERLAVQAPLAQRVGGRIAAHTGAATLGGLGGMEGYREGGIPGAIAGGAMGIMAPELIASPEGQMAIARTLNKAKNLRPLVGMAAQADRKRDEE